MLFSDQVDKYHLPDDKLGTCWGFAVHGKLKGVAGCATMLPHRRPPEAQSAVICNRSLQPSDAKSKILPSKS